MESELTPESNPSHFEPSAKWVGYELHDGLLQWLVGARMMLEAKLDRPQPEGLLAKESEAFSGSGSTDWSNAEVRELLKSTFLSLGAAIDEGRALITFLEQHTEHPHFDIQQATEDFLDFLPRHTAIGEIKFLFDGLDRVVTLPPQVGWNVLRIIQQAVRNALFHSGASTVKVSVKEASDLSSCQVTVHDDGCGFDVANAVAKSARSNHFGLASMQHRAQQLGGELRIESVPGEGSRVEFSFPASFS